MRYRQRLLGASNRAFTRTECPQPCLVQRQSNSRGWLHRMFPRKRHQMRHLFDLTCLLAKQMLSQLSYTPTTTI